MINLMESIRDFDAEPKKLGSQKAIEIGKMSVLTALGDISSSKSNGSANNQGKWLTTL